MEPVSYRPIGVVESPFETPDEVPRPGNEPVAAEGAIILEDQFEPGLEGLDSFSHVTAITHLHLVEEGQLRVRPFGDGDPVGIFATSGPSRPNPIGQSILTLEGIDGTRLSVSNLDLVDGTPVLDLKPYAPKGPPLEDLEIGWMGTLNG